MRVEGIKRPNLGDYNTTVKECIESKFNLRTIDRLCNMQRNKVCMETVIVSWVGERYESQKHQASKIPLIKQ